LGIQEDIYKGVAYVVGVYLAMFSEDRLALGLSRIEVVAEKQKAKDITNALRAKGYDGVSLVLFIDILRKDRLYRSKK